MINPVTLAGLVPPPGLAVTGTERLRFVELVPYSNRAVVWNPLGLTDPWSTMPELFVFHSVPRTTTGRKSEDPLATCPSPAVRVRVMSLPSPPL